MRRQRVRMFVRENRSITAEEGRVNGGSRSRWESFPALPPLPVYTPNCCGSKTKRWALWPLPHHRDRPQTLTFATNPLIQQQAHEPTASTSKPQSDDEFRWAQARKKETYVSLSLSYPCEGANCATEGAPTKRGWAGVEKMIISSYLLKKKG